MSCIAVRTTLEYITSSKSSLNKQEVDDLQQVAARHRVLLPSPQQVTKSITFWVHASSAARFDADIRKLACDAGIPGCDDPQSDTFALVYSWLRNRRNGK